MADNNDGFLRELYSGATSVVSSITGSTSDTTTTSSSTNNDGGGLGALAELTGVVDVLKAFGRSPAGFILGAVLSTILGGVETIVTALLNAVTFVFLGAGAGTAGALGLADIPLFAAEILIGSTSGIATSILGVLDTVIGTVTTVAAAAGPAAPLVLAGATAGTLVATAVLLRTLLEVGADLVPGLGGLL